LVAQGWLERGLPSGRGATTDVQVRQVGTTAEIAEADIYVNLENFEFGDAPDGLDRRGVLTHEIGHLLGLLHPCEIDASPPTPACTSSAESEASVLYPSYNARTTLSDDDVQGLCALYPAVGCPLSCGISRRCVADQCIACGNADCAPSCPGPRCASTECGAGAYCAEGSCAAYGELAGHCVDPGMTGAACASGEECATDLCLIGDDQSFCTTSCTDDHACSS
jgi:hypothetical protein